jgi:DivIVA domain-containing protein
MPEERLISISSSSHLAPDEVARHSFGSVRRGYDPSEVRAYLESIAIGLRGLAEREQQLLEELADAEHRAAHPVLDEPTLSAAVGSETARVLHSAHEAAAEMVAKSEAEANRLLSEAREEIEQSRAEAAGRLAQLTAESETAANELRERTAQQAAAHLEAVRHEAEEMLVQAREQCRSMVDEAQGLRTRVLADLSKRRKVLHAQIEQLRAGRERLAETVKDVRRSVDEIAADLFAAEDNARLAAEAAGREALDRPDEGSPEELATLLLAEELDGAGVASAGPVELEVTGVGETTEETAVVGPAEVGPAEPAEGGPAEPPGQNGSSSGEGPGSSPVEALFAKLRASREGQLVEEGVDAQAVVDEPVGEVVEVVEVIEVTEAVPVPVERARREAPAEHGDAPGDVEPDRGVADENGSGGGPADGPPGDRNPLAVRRDELIGPIVKSLSRRLKRTLQDEQNELLDGLRSNGSKWSADVLPDLGEQTDSYTTAALPFLEEASEAGATFAGTKKSAKPSTDELIGIGHVLAEAVIGPLRRRLSDDEGLSDADESVMAEHVGSAFREWKGERIERLAGDHVVAAFSAGTIAATKGKKSVALEWVSDSRTGDAPCPDCEDNGLNGSLQPDEEFPTGHRHPPAHPGCRCLLAVSAP